MTRDEIRTIMLANGFTIKPGQTDLMPYVYEAAKALIEAEREACAKACESASWGIDILVWLQATKKSISEMSARACADAIRRRSNQPA